MADNFHEKSDQDDDHHLGIRVISLREVLIRLLIVISLVEISIMFFFAAVDLNLSVVPVAILDAFLLAVCSVPFVYFWVIKPFVLARDEAEEYIKRMALYDSLTDLPNRRLLDIHLGRAIEQSIREKTYGAVILLDLDYFKPINDNHGHEAGDVVLKEVSSRIQNAIRRTDLPARLGGDEFVILLTHVGNNPTAARATAISIANKIREAISRPFDFLGASLKVDASVGVSLISPDTTTEAVLRDADTAMYQAKKAGRKRVNMFSE